MTDRLINGVLRLIAWYRGDGPQAWLSSISLVVSNLFIIWGVLFLHWDVFSIMFLFWAENIVIGVFNVGRMMTASGGLADDSTLTRVFALIGKLFTVAFFCAHYGMFCAIHLIFVIAIFGLAGHGPHPPLFPAMQAVTDLHVWQGFRLILAQAPGLIYPLAVLGISHGVSFVHDYLLRGEYRQANSRALMAQPYARIVLLQLTLFAGAFFIVATGSSRFALCLLIVIKTLIDLFGHWRERTKYAPEMSQPPVPA